jgi:predicted lipoprotein with Yx(FWY)xxD motif
MRRLSSKVRARWIAALLAALTAAAQADVNLPEYWQPVGSSEREDYVRVPTPPGIQVVATELEGPVFADSRGHTLYRWPLKDLRNGDVGDRQKGASTCTGEVLRETSGLMSPYPAGLLLPELDKRPSCAQVWPPLIAPADAKPIGKWTLAPREDGSKQWAYDGYPLYTSILDRKPGDTLGGTQLENANDAPAVRVPVGPPPRIPPEFAVVPMATGRLLVNHKGFAVYAWDGDEMGKSNCTGQCLSQWSPVIAPETAESQGEWTTIERSPGIRQWTFRGRPLYTYILDPRTRSVMGSDVPGWHNVYTQRALPPPKEFRVEDSRIGQVLADERGRTIYLYNCSDDALDQLACDHPDTPQQYRLAICGNGDPQLCRATFPYVEAPPDAKSDSSLWTVMTIDPNTGRRATPGRTDVLHVWAYRDRPVYTFGQDVEPGDANGDAYGEFNGYRNGYKAFWLRDDFRSNAFRR